MTPNEIEELFYETITKTRALYNKIDGYTEDMIYNWKTVPQRKKPTLGDMLSVLYQLGLIEANLKE